MLRYSDTATYIGVYLARRWKGRWRTIHGLDWMATALMFWLQIKSHAAWRSDVLVSPVDL